MTTYDEMLQSVLDAPDGPEVAAFFDFDGTLIAGYSAISFIREQLLTGKLSGTDFVDLTSARAQFGLGKSEFTELMAVSARIAEGESEKSYFEFGEHVFEKHIARAIYPESRELVNAHLKKGHTVAVISSATRYQVEPAANALDIEHVFCSRMEVKRGKFTGNIVEPLCWGEGKRDVAESMAENSGLDLDESFF